MRTIKAPAFQVVIRPAEKPKQTDSGIVLPGNKAEVYWRGEVLAAGPDAKSVKPGDTMIYPVHAAKEFEVEGEKLVSIAADVCFAMVRDE